MRTKLLITGLAAAVAACGGDNTTCGTGTTKMGGECVATGNGGSGNDTTCGTGTHLMGTMCVPDDNTVAAAPTISMMDPVEAGISGGGLFTITGTGFNGSNVTDLHVFFGDPTDANCEATLGAASATQLSGQVPFACSLSPSVTVTVTTNVGSATTPFNYDMIFAGDGLGGANVFDNTVVDGGSVYVIDPFAAKSFSLGTPTDADGNAYSYGGMDFDATGKLFAATTGFGTSDANGTSQLLVFDLAAQSLTVVGDITDADGTAYNIADIKFSGGTLYGWANFDLDGAGSGTQTGSTLISIDTTTGAATVIGDPTTVALTDTAFLGGMTVDPTGNLVVAPSGGLPDSGLGLTGELDTVSTTDGSLTNIATLDWYNSAPVAAMATFPGATPLMLAVIDNGTYGPVGSDGLSWANETLAIIDPTADTANGEFITNEIFEISDSTGFQPHIDAIAIPPSSLVLQRKLPRTGWVDLKKVAGGRVLAPRHR